MQEAVDHRGHRIESFTVETWQNSAWQQVAEGTTVGHKRLLRLSSPVTAERVRLRIMDSRLEPSLAQVGLFKQAAYVPAPSISDPDSSGAVTLSAPQGAAGGGRIVYTVNGSLPTAQSAVYRSPILLAQGGSVRAAELGAEGKLGMIAAKDFPGQSTTGWKVVDVDSQQQDALASASIDGNPETRWETATTSGPHHITLDMETPRRIAGLTYLPRQDGRKCGELVDSRLAGSYRLLGGWIVGVALLLASVAQAPQCQLPFHMQWFDTGWSTASPIFSALPRRCGRRRKIALAGLGQSS